MNVWREQSSEIRLGRCLQRHNTRYPLLGMMQKGLMYAYPHPSDEIHFQLGYQTCCIGSNDIQLVKGYRNILTALNFLSEVS